MRTSSSKYTLAAEKRMRIEKKRKNGSTISVQLCFKEKLHVQKTVSHIVINPNTAGALCAFNFCSQIKVKPHTYIINVLMHMLVHKYLVFTYLHVFSDSTG